MKGYFSRIAKHSGLRLVGPGGGARTVGDKPISHLPAPLSIEETVLVPRADVAENILGSPERKQEEKAQMAEQQMPKARERHTQDPTIREGAQARWTQKSNREHAREEVPLNSLAPSELEGITQSARVEKASAESQAAREIHIVGRTSFADAGMSAAHAEAQSAKAEESHVQTDESEPFEKGAKKRHFTKTAEVIERGGLGVAEIQDIVFHEVQEWAAASPTRSDIQEVRAAETSGSIVKQKIAQAVSQRGVVTINDERRKETAESAETPGLEEASFNLSIGTISVVIEDAVPPLRQAELGRQDRGNQHARQVSGRQLPRLSRHYL